MQSNKLQAALASMRARLDAADSGPWRGHGFAIYSESELAKETESYIGEIRNDFDRTLVINCHQDLRQLCDALEVLWKANELVSKYGSYSQYETKEALVAKEARAKVEAIFGKNLEQK